MLLDAHVLDEFRKGRLSIVWRLLLVNSVLDVLCGFIH